MRSIKEKLIALFPAALRFTSLKTHSKTHEQTDTKTIRSNTNRAIEVANLNKTQARHGIEWQSETIDKEFNESKTETEKIFS